MARADLQLAWTFTTGSLEYTTGWLVAMRDDATARVPVDGPAYTVLSVRDNVSDTIFRTIEGEMTVPYYMTDLAQPGATLIIDDDNQPVYQGELAVPFTVHIPHSCLGQACPIVQYGHGLLSTREEVRATPASASVGPRGSGVAPRRQRATLPSPTYDG